MSMTDPIADMLTRIRNAIMARHDKVNVPASKLKVRICEILKEEGYISDFMRLDDRRQGLVEIELKWFKPRENAISGLSRFSIPGRRKYCKHHEIPKVLNGLGIAIMSTPKGVMTDSQARHSHVGGEWLCSIW